MSKQTIRKNLSDAEMFKGMKETITFENNPVEEETPKQIKAKPKKQEADLHTAFFTPELQEKVGKALLDVKLQLFKEGVVDFDIKVSREGTKIILTPVPAKAPKQSP